MQNKNNSCNVNECNKPCDDLGLGKCSPFYTKYYFMVPNSFSQKFDSVIENFDNINKSKKSVNAIIWMIIILVIIYIFYNWNKE